MTKANDTLNCKYSSNYMKGPVCNPWLKQLDNFNSLEKWKYSMQQVEDRKLGMD